MNAQPARRPFRVLLIGLVALLAVAACNPGNPDGTPVGAGPGVVRVAA
jgi:hypothetical protein